MKPTLVFLVTTLVCLTTACAEASTSEPTAVPTNTPLPATEQPLPTDTSTPEPTPTDIPTDTPVPTEIPTLTPTETDTPTPEVETITLGAPDDPDGYPHTMTINFVVEGEDLNTIVGNTLSTEPVGTCPSVWIQAVADRSIPTYTVYIDGTQEGEILESISYIMTIHPTIPEMDPYGLVAIGMFTPGSSGKLSMTLYYEPAAGEQLPEELEIQAVFPGCEILKTLVAWP